MLYVVPAVASAAAASGPGAVDLDEYLRLLRDNYTRSTSSG